MGKRGPKPGSPRQGGRAKGTVNKVTKTIQQLADPYGPEALEILVRIMRKDKSSMARIAACREVMDRAYGKSSQPLTAPNGSGGLIIEIMRFVPTIEHHPIQEVLPAPSGDP
jgi:hypothetical protein